MQTHQNILYPLYMYEEVDMQTGAQKGRVINPYNEYLFLLMGDGWDKYSLFILPMNLYCGYFVSKSR